MTLWVSFILLLGICMRLRGSATTQIVQDSWAYPNSEECEHLVPASSLLSSQNLKINYAPEGDEFKIGGNQSKDEDDEGAVSRRRQYPERGSKVIGAQDFPDIGPPPGEFGSAVGDTWENDFDPGDEPSPQEWLIAQQAELRKKRQHFVRKILKKEQKRTHGAQVHTHQHHWSCEAEYAWRNLGRNHYPQFIQTANCTSATCLNGLFQCVPREYTIKVLKKLEPDEVVHHSTAAQLPETIRAFVKFINVTVNICCECSLT